MTRDGITVAVQVTPGAAADRIDGVVPGPDGPVLKLRVTAAPERGRANAAAIRLLARAWNLAPGRLSVVDGETARRKVVAVAGDPAVLLAALRAWKDGFDG